MTAVPRLGSHLPGEVFRSNALSLFVVCHAVSGNSIPNSVDERLGAGFRSFAAGIGGRYVAGGLAGDGSKGLLVEMGDRLSHIPRLYLPRRILNNEFARIEANQHPTIACYRINPPDNWLRT